MDCFKGKPPAGVSPQLLKALELVCRTNFRSRPAGPAPAVAGLSRLFTKERTALHRTYLDDPDHAAAYLSYFLPVNLSKIQVLLDEMPEDTQADQKADGLHLLDLGSGPGTGALALLDWLRQRRPEQTRRLTVVAADSSAEALKLAKSLWDGYCGETGTTGARLNLCEANLERAPGGSWGDPVKADAPYDLIVLANCLNELFTQAADPVASRAGLIAELLPLLAPHGTMMIVEPALRETSRDLHRLRDRLLQEQRCTIYSPCLHERNCPALVHPDDWCHEERAWEAPPGIKAIDQEVGFIKDALKFSYLLLRKDGKTIVPRRPQTFRLVSELRELKGDTRAWVCNELGRSEVGRLDRTRSETNAAWDECQRGAIVWIEGLQRKEGAMLGRIPAEGTVEIVRPV